MAKFLNFNFSLSAFFDKVDALSPAHLIALAAVAIMAVVAMLGLTYFVNMFIDVMRWRRSKNYSDANSQLPQTSFIF